MSRMKHIALATTLGTALLATALAGCGSGSTSSANGQGCKKVGVLLPESNTSPRYDNYDAPDLKKDIPADLSGATVDYYNAGGSATTQISQAQSALTKGDCILIVDPSDLNSAATIVSKAKAQGVPVIAYDRLINSADLAYYVSYDNVKVGELQGQYIVQNYQKYEVNGATPNVIMINGSQTDNNAVLFRQGAHNALDTLFNNNTLKKVYETYTPNWDPPTAEKEASGALSANNNNIQIVYSANDSMATTIITALQAAGLDQPNNGNSPKVLVTGQDAGVPGLQQILEGTQAMTIFKEYATEANATAKLVAAISNGTSTSSMTNGAVTKTPGGTNIPSVLLAPEVITSANVSDVVTSGQVTKSDICSGIPSGTNTNGFC